LSFGNRSGFVFIDEIQRKANAGLFLKGIFDINVGYKFIISGSGSLELKEKIHESLTGRKRIFELLPVNFEEFINFRTNYDFEDRLQLFFEVEKEVSQHLLQEYLQIGGYPRIVVEQNSSERIALMHEIYSSYLQKDIALLLKVDRPNAFTNMIQWLAASIGSIVNWSQVATDVQLSLPTLKKYIWYAEKTFILHELKPFYKNRIKEIIKAPVIYFNDIGMLLNALGQFGQPLLPAISGFVFQNFIFLMLYNKLAGSNLSLHFWRTTDQAEVDFIIKSGNKILPVEVKYSHLKKEKVSRSLRNFCERYEPAFAFIVNLSFQKEIYIGKTEVKFIPYYWLLFNDIKQRIR